MARAKAVMETVDDPPRPQPAKPTAQPVKSSRKDRKVAKQQAVRPTYERRYRQTIRKVDLWTVLKIAVCFYLTALLVMLFAGMVLWWIASALGMIENLEDFMGELVESDDFRFLSWDVLRGASLVGLVLVCIMVVITVLAAAFYNLFAELLGGIEVTVVEEENVSR
jgi:Transmembrane domain of unknown function (DUF3566)